MNEIIFNKNIKLVEEIFYEFNIDDIDITKEIPDHIVLYLNAYANRELNNKFIISKFIIRMDTKEILVVYNHN